MIILKVKIKNEKTTTIQTEYLPDEYVVSKQNAELQNLVKLICDSTGLEEIEEVKVTATFEW